MVVERKRKQKDKSPLKIRERTENEVMKKMKMDQRKISDKSSEALYTAPWEAPSGACSGSTACSAHFGADWGRSVVTIEGWSG
jgi:hypothetical protein